MKYAQLFLEYPDLTLLLSFICFCTFVLDSFVISKAYDLNLWIQHGILRINLHSSCLSAYAFTSVLLI